MNPRYLPLQMQDCARLHAYISKIDAERRADTGKPADGEAGRIHALPPNILSKTWLPLTRFAANLRGHNLVQSAIPPRRRPKIVVASGGELESRLFALFQE